jgi:hypothetical protein
MMYSVSGEHRMTAWENLKNAWELGLLKMNLEAADLALGIIVLLATVDVSRSHPTRLIIYPLPE